MRLELGTGAPVGGCRQVAGRALLAGAHWFTARAVNDGLEWHVPPGMLSSGAWLTADMLLDGTEGVKLVLALAEGVEGPAFRVAFGLLPQAQARVRLPLTVTDQNRWMLPREGAWLKPLCGGDKVDLAKVDRVRLFVEAKGDRPVRWCMTPLVVTDQEPPLLDKPLLPKGVLIDALGQSAIRKWRGRSRSREEVTRRLKRQHKDASRCAWPEGFSRWGGDMRRKVEASGFFRTHHDGSRWWLVDPDGFLFWSAGMDCVRATIDANTAGLTRALARPKVAVKDKADYLVENFRQAFGRSWHDRWATITLAFLRRTGFNTIANWSEWEVASAAAFPYVRPLHWQGELRTPWVFRDMPDVFHPDLARDAEAFGAQLAATRDDPALIGYFLMNEPTWGFAQQTPAEGMLYATESCCTREEFSRWLKGKYGSDRGLADAWGSAVTLASVASGRWVERTPPGAKADLEAYSTVMVGKLFGTLSAACKRVDPNHLNLGARYHTVPPAWALAGMKGFDVFSINCYSERVRKDLAPVAAMMNAPAMIGEWHFGAHDAGLPASGIGRVKDQAARGRAYRVYLEDAAAQPWCVGVHWFTLYDQSALGRGDGENYQIGFLDVCNRPYGPITEAARASHERMYQVAAGEEKPFDDAPEYLPKLFY